MHSENTEPTIPVSKAGIFAFISGLYFLAIVFVFSDVLFSAKNLVISSSSTDLYQQYIHWRHFGFSELSQGNVALWNPHIFSGTPYLGGFQSALFYPPNWLYCFLPLAEAVNWGIVINLIISGVTMFYWTRYHKLHPVACFIAGLMYIFCGPQFLHVYAGHLSNLCTMAWVPLIFLAIDGLSRTIKKNHAQTLYKEIILWIMLGATAITLQILAGHPQYVFYTAIATGIYTLLQTRSHKKKLLFLTSSISLYIGAAALSAIQLLPGISSFFQGTRGNHVSYTFASMFSFPPENLLTLFTPDFFGSISAYWGRCFLWETSLFFTITGFILAITGVIYGQKTVRRLSVIMIPLLFILALGSHSPLFPLLYNYAPGFDAFRGNSKFILPMTAFAIMLATLGLDYFLKCGILKSRLPAAILFCVAMIGATAILVFNMELSRIPGENLWGNTIQSIAATNEVYLNQQYYTDPGFMRGTAGNSITSAFISMLTILILAFILTIYRYTRHARYGIIGLVITEMLVFAFYNKASFDVDNPQSDELKKIYQGGDYRVINGNHNLAMSLNGYDAWGNDAAVPQRYAEFMAFAFKQDPDNATQYLQFNIDPTNPHPTNSLLSMIRCKYMFLQNDNDLIAKQVSENTAPHAMIVHDYAVIKDRDKIFDAMSYRNFDYRQTVILESTPDIIPQAKIGNELAEVTEISSDHLTILAQLSSNGILLITDSYDQDWTAEGISNNQQTTHTVMPANYVLRAIPLPSGTHRIRLDYSPKSFSTGKYISIGTLLAMSIGLIICYPNSKKDESV